MRIARTVIDTNILVSACLTPFNNSGQIGYPWQVMQLVLAGLMRMYYSEDIFEEYRRRLREPPARFNFKFSPDQIQSLLDQIKNIGVCVEPYCLSDHERLDPKDEVDPKDEMFLMTALAGNAQYLITRNFKDYPLPCRRGIRVVSPREFIESIS